MANRTQLQGKLEELLGSRQVYYQPPESVKMQYPAIIYSKKKPNGKYANNSKYFKMDCYEIIVIDVLPDHPVIEAILKLPYTSWERHYTADNHNHDVINMFN